MRIYQKAKWDFPIIERDLPLQLRKGGLYEVSEDLDIKARLYNLTHKVEALALGRRMNSVNQVQSKTCSICASPMHTTQMCPSTVGYPKYCTEQANALNNYGRPLASPFSETYNPDWQNHSPTNIGGEQVHQQSQFRPPTQAFPPIPQSTPHYGTTKTTIIFGGVSQNFHAIN